MAACTNVQASPTLHDVSNIVNITRTRYSTIYCHDLSRASGIYLKVPL